MRRPTPFVRLAGLVLVQGIELGRGEGEANFSPRSKRSRPERGGARRGRKRLFLLEMSTSKATNSRDGRIPRRRLTRRLPKLYSQFHAGLVLRAGARAKGEGETRRPLGPP